MSTKTHAIAMANQIARNFATLHVDSAALATADHIAQFWDPRMKALMFAYLEEGGADLTPPARRALEILRDQGAPPPQTPATVFGSGRSDAG